jgi:hypothetical protein
MGNHMANHVDDHMADHVGKHVADNRGDHVALPERCRPRRPTGAILDPLLPPPLAPVQACLPPADAPPPLHPAEFQTDCSRYPPAGVSRVNIVSINKRVQCRYGISRQQRRSVRENNGFRLQLLRMRNQIWIVYIWNTEISLFYSCLRSKDYLDRSQDNTIFSTLRAQSATDFS